MCTAGPQPGTFPAQCARLDLNLGPSQLQPGTFPAQCAPLDLNGQIRMPDKMSDRMPEDMPDKVPECLPDRMPEDLSR